MANYMLIAGCSHAAGSEIDGNLSSPVNRQASFGNQLAKMMDHTPINIARNGSSNGAIHRSVLNWFTLNQDLVSNKANNLFVLVNWAESCRIEAPVPHDVGIDQDTCADWADPSFLSSVQVNAMTDPHHVAPQEKEQFLTAQRFLVYSEIYTECLTAKDALSLQYFFKAENIRYLMTNSGIAFNNRNMKWLRPYLSKIDAKRYYMYRDNNYGFYEKYKEAGMINPNAKYGHHGADAHLSRATDLFNYIKQKNI
jgi:hypothetical protein